LSDAGIAREKALYRAQRLQCDQMTGSALTGKGKTMAKAEAWVMIPKLDEKKTGCILEMKPLVLCKDCKHWHDEHDGHCTINDIFTTPDWFCADGERR